jgi:hypothetical protein
MQGDHLGNAGGLLAALDHEIVVHAQSVGWDGLRDRDTAAQTSGPAPDSEYTRWMVGRCVLYPECEGVDLNQRRDANAPHNPMLSEFGYFTMQLAR